LELITVEPVDPVAVAVEMEVPQAAQQRAVKAITAELVRMQPQLAVVVAAVLVRLVKMPTRVQVRLVTAETDQSQRLAAQVLLIQAVAVVDPDTAAATE
jgi:hypothetical protein